MTVIVGGRSSNWGARHWKENWDCRIVSQLLHILAQIQMGAISGHSKLSALDAEALDLWFDIFQNQKDHKS
jgi:hypothetical protein